MIDEIFLRNIVREIMRECTNAGTSVNENFCRYYVTLLIIDPRWGITPDLGLNRADVQSFVKHCVSVFINQSVPSIVLLKMQLYFSTHFLGREEMVRKHKRSLEGQLAPLLKEIIETEELHDDEETAKYHKKILYYSILLSGLGNPTEPAVFREGLATLKSVFFASDLQEFLTLPKAEKEVALQEITELVAGIRIYNSECDKGGGAGIEEVSDILEKAVASVNRDIQITLITLMDKVNLLTSALDNSYSIDYDPEKDTHTLVPKLSENVTIEKLEYYRDLLVVYRQLEIYVRKTLCEVNDIGSRSVEILEMVQQTIDATHQTVRYRIAIPVGQVYPLFKELYKIHTMLQNEALYMTKLNQILYNLNIYVGQFEIEQQLLVAMVGDSGILTDEERLAQTTGITIDTVSSDMCILEPNQVKDFDKLPIQYLGFCAYKLVETGGCLIPGNPNMGVGYSNKLHFVFSSPAAAHIFGKAPETYILKAYELMRRKPELINFLKVYEQLKRLRRIKELIIKPAEIIVKHDVEMQTDVHPIPTKIDPDYKWNVWDWKRQALMFADISTRLTRSTQTNKSNWRNPAKAQTQELRDKNLQTKKDNYSNVPTLSNFIYGLRGRKDNKQFIITLTRPVKE